MNLSLNEHVRRIVAEAIRQDSVLYVASAARALVFAHPEEELCTKAVAEMLVETGIHARIPLEIDTAVRRRPQMLTGRLKANPAHGPHADF